jgi:nicotinamidase-related amidase
MEIQAYPLPKHFNPAHAYDSNYEPDLQGLFPMAIDWKKKLSIPDSGTKGHPKIHFLGIDLQKSFCFPDGSLYVGGRSGKGAMEDNVRIAEFIYRYLGAISDITLTLDTHFAYQIFFTPFWLDQNGQHPNPMTEVTVEEVRAGKYRPNPAIASWVCSGDYTWLQQYVEHYCSELEKTGKYKLMLWPYHCLLGSKGHTLAGVILEAHYFHSFVKGQQNWCEMKGSNPLTENYSVLRPEVILSHDAKSLGSKNTGLIQKLLASDAVIIGGQAASHCVASTIDDLLTEILDRDPNLVKKVYILEDCMSAVTVPNPQGGFYVDFTPQAEAFLKKFKSAGMHVVKSTEPMENWINL